MVFFAASFESLYHSIEHAHPKGEQKERERESSNGGGGDRLLLRERVQGPEDHRRRAGAPGAGSVRRRRQEQRLRGAGGGAEGEPGVGGGQGGGQQRRAAARLRRARRRRVQRRRGGAGVAGHPLRGAGAPHARTRPRLDRQRGPARGVHLLPPRDGPDQGVPGEGDPVLRGAAAVRRGDAVRAELPGDGARAGGVPGAGGGAGREGPALHLHGAEQERHQIDARARVGGRLRHLRQGRGREARAGAGHGRGVAPRRRRAHHPRPAEAHARVPGPQGTPHVVQHGGGDARQGAQLRHARRRVRDPRRLRAPMRRDHRGGEHPVPVGEGGHPHPRQPRHAPRPPPLAAAAQGPRRHLQVKMHACMMESPSRPAGRRRC